MSQNSTIAIVIALLLLGVAGYLLFGKEDATGVLETQGPASAAEMTFIHLTSKIDPVTFDSSILEDPRFKQLKDIRTAIIPEVSGKIDPFAPLGSSK